MDIELIRATREDKGFLLELRKLTMVGHLAAAGIVLSDREHEFRIDDDFDCAFMVQSSGRSIGMAKYRETANQLEIMQLQILPECQGMGVGRRLMESFIETARTKRIHIVLTVLKGNPARRLYESLGFETVGEDEHEFHLRYAADSGHPG